MHEEENPLGDPWITAALFPVFAVTMLVLGLIIGGRAVLDRRYEDLPHAALLLGGSLFMLRLVYQSKVGGATFADRVLRGFLISGYGLIFLGVSILVLGWTKTSGGVARSEGIGPTVAGVAFVLVSSVLQRVRKARHLRQARPGIAQPEMGRRKATGAKRRSN